MKRTDVYFVVAVFAFAALFAALSLSYTEQVLSAGTAGPGPALGAAGTPRDVDVRRIEKLIRRGDLSDREADFYREAGAAMPPVDRAPQPGP